MTQHSINPPSNLFEHIVTMVSSGSTVLDVGCNDGHLLELLIKKKQVRARGLEISRAGVGACVARGLSVVQGDANTDLADYPDQSFDYIILTQTIQAMQRPLEVLEQSLRIGRRVIVSTPNFAHWRLRLSLLFKGRMPQSPALPTPWYQTDNIHLCTISDFIDLCEGEKINLEQAWAVHNRRPASHISQSGSSRFLANIRAEEALFLLAKGGL